MSFHEGIKLNRQLLMITDIDNKPVIINLKESPLRWLASFKEKNGQPFLEESELLAGEKFRLDFNKAGMVQKMNVDYQAVKVDNNYNPNFTSDVRLEAQSRLNLAEKQMGRELYSLMQDFLGFLLSIEACEQKRGWPIRSGKIVIKLALAQLARHYGYVVKPQ